jgi:hypothetical protein
MNDPIAVDIQPPNPMPGSPVRVTLKRAQSLPLAFHSSTISPGASPLLSLVCDSVLLVALSAGVSIHLSVSVRVL